MGGRRRIDYFLLLLKLRVSAREVRLHPRWIVDRLFFFLSTPSALSIPISRWISSPPLVAQLPSASIRSNDRQTDSKKKIHNPSLPKVFHFRFKWITHCLKKKKGGKIEWGGQHTHTHTQKSRRNNPIDLIQSNGVAFYLFILLFFLLFTLV